MSFIVDHFQELVLLINALAALAAVAAALRNAGKIHQVHLAINSRLDALLKLTAVASHAEGVVEGARRVANGDPPSVAYPAASDDKVAGR